MTESDEVMARVQKDFKANQDTLDKTLARNAKIEADKKLYGKLTDSDRIKVDEMVEQGEAEMRKLAQETATKLQRIKEKYERDIRKITHMSKSRVEKFARSIHPGMCVSAEQYAVGEYGGELGMPKGYCFDSGVHSREYYGESKADLWHKINQDLLDVKWVGLQKCECENCLSSEHD